ncbi:MAG TPA: hypothetical protein VJL29_01175 [Thermoguttaceae bacterium]|nr:hypothetical protein [Thermoguttaceae bacterium]
MENNKTTDDIVEQVRQVKAALAESVNFNIDRIVNDAKKKQAESHRTILEPPVRQDA